MAEALGFANKFAPARPNAAGADDDDAAGGAASSSKVKVTIGLSAEAQGKAAAAALTKGMDKDKDKDDGKDKDKDKDNTEKHERKKLERVEMVRALLPELLQFRVKPDSNSWTVSKEGFFTKIEVNVTPTKGAHFWVKGNPVGFERQFSWLKCEGIQTAYKRAQEAAGWLEEQ